MQDNDSRARNQEPGRLSVGDPVWLCRWHTHEASPGDRRKLRGRVLTSIGQVCIPDTGQGSHNSFSLQNDSVRERMPPARPRRETGQQKGCLHTRAVSWRGGEKGPEATAQVLGRTRNTWAARSTKPRGQNARSLRLRSPAQAARGLQTRAFTSARAADSELPPGGRGSSRRPGGSGVGISLRWLAQG